MDFVTELPTSTFDSNALLTITDKLTKFVTLIPGRNTSDAGDWAIRYFDCCYSKYGPPGVIISDRDPRFVSVFWPSLFQRARIDLAYTAAYHAAADCQSQRTNQTVEAALRCLTADPARFKWVSDWEELLLDVEYGMNTATNTSTGRTLFEMLHGVQPRLENEIPQKSAGGEANGESPAEDFFEVRSHIRLEAGDTLRLAQAKIARYFSQNHSPFSETHLVWLKLAKCVGTRCWLPNLSTLDVRKAVPVRVRRRIGKVAFELELPAN